MRRFYCGKEDCRPKRKKTIYENRAVFHEYLWIDQFVWALAVYGLRMGYCASFDCSGVSQKIHLRKIEVGQGLAHDPHLREHRFLDATGLARTRQDSQGALWELPGRARSHQDA